MENKKLEKIIKGVANWRRIAIMVVVAKQPGLPLIEIANVLKINLKTASDHVSRLSLAGILAKRHEGNLVRHTLTPIGKGILKFLKILDKH